MNIQRSHLGMLASASLVGIWICAFYNRTPSLNGAYDVNLQPVSLITREVPPEFASTEPVVIPYASATNANAAFRYDDRVALYQENFKSEWETCVRYFPYPSKQDCEYHDFYYDEVPKVLPESISKLHMYYAQRDGYKACSNHISSLLAVDPELHRKLIYPAYTRFYLPLAITFFSFVALGLSRLAIRRSRRLVG